MCQLFLKKGCLAKYWQKTGQIAGVKCLAVDLGRGFDHSGKTVAKNRKLPPTARPAGKVSVSTTTARRIPVRRHFPTWLAAAGLVLMALAVYWPGMQGGFISFDDPDNVTQNILLRPVDWGKSGPCPAPPNSIIRCFTHPSGWSIICGDSTRRATMCLMCCCTHWRRFYCGGC